MKKYGPHTLYSNDTPDKFFTKLWFIVQTAKFNSHQHFYFYSNPSNVIPL